MFYCEDGGGDAPVQETVDTGNVITVKTVVEMRRNRGASKCFHCEDGGGDAPLQVNEQVKRNAVFSLYDGGGDAPLQVNAG